MYYRNEWKHIITYSDMLALRQRLRAVMQPDPHVGQGGSYFIRSLYFDTPTDKALREKLDGVNTREKFRLRYYNEDTSLIHLEKKSKLNGVGHKDSVIVTATEAQRIVEGDTDWMADSGRPLVTELYSKMQSQCLRPKTIVDYTRDPFVYAPGNVRVTLDYNIRTGLMGTDFLDPHCLTIPAGDNVTVLEVKWDEFLPSHIRDAVQLGTVRSGAFSKYQACRIYG